jgi:hypothetical protein
LLCARKGILTTAAVVYKIFPAYMRNCEGMHICRKRFHLFAFVLFGSTPPHPTRSTQPEWPPSYPQRLRCTKNRLPSCLSSP